MLFSNAEISPELNPQTVVKTMTAGPEWRGENSEGLRTCECPTDSFSALSLQQRPNTDLPESRPRHRRCVSSSLEPSIPEMTHNEGSLCKPQIARKVSLEPGPDPMPSGCGEMTSDASSQDRSREKRRRNTSSTDIQSEEVQAQEQTNRSPRKRRRIHERKQAMVASDFDQIFNQIGL